MKDLVSAPKSKIDTNTYRKQLQSLEALRAGKPEPDFKTKRVPPPNEGKGLYDPVLAPKSKIEMKNYRQQVKALEALRAGEPEPKFKKKWVEPPDDGKGLPPAVIRKGTVVQRQNSYWGNGWDEQIKAERIEHKEAKAQKNLKAINSARSIAEKKRNDHANTVRARGMPETYFRKNMPAAAKMIDMCDPEPRGGPRITTRAQRSEIPIPLVADVPARRPSLRGKSKADKTAHKSPPQLEAEPEILKGKALYEKLTTPSVQPPNRRMSFNAYGQSTINKTGILVPTYYVPKAKEKEAAEKAARMEVLQAAEREHDAMLRKVEESFEDQDKRLEARRKRENIDDRIELRSEESLRQRRDVEFLKKRPVGLFRALH
ncbi:hypothetical protein J4E85_003089 [Alternaria conjuncta]|uniref:uncharacterized protein n=1 Tax=Alternaria conjuncta TaxID=181017 RepID=UPI00221E7C6F|nr:uncharacterized protein J4E85_003089 [Alternaria conjuncta]KAI4932691.1 hypothetical protein J4E85_003089 [Alternaria conjuncta]